MSHLPRLQSPRRNRYRRQERLSAQGRHALPARAARLSLPKRRQLCGPVGYRQDTRNGSTELSSMSIVSLDHVQLAMPPGREQEARAFYEGVLEIPEVIKPPHLAKRGGCWFERGPLKVHLGVENEFRPARKAHPAFTVNDLTGLSDRLSAAGRRCLRCP